MRVGEEAIRNSYTQLFAEQIPEFLFYQRDRPHYFNLLIKIIALFILLALIPILTILPIYPFLYVLLINNFNTNSAFGGSSGKINLYWIGALYLFYIFNMGSLFGGKTSGTATKVAGGSAFVGLMMGITPLMVLLTWWYAMPVSIHDAVASIYNSVFDKMPFSKGWISYSHTHCPGDVNARLISCGDPMSGSGLDLTLFGIGLSGSGLVVLSTILIMMIVAYIWILWKSRQIEKDTGSNL